MEYFSDRSTDIKRFPHWTLILNRNQSYLGRAICYLNTHKENITELSTEEYLELLDIIGIYQKALTILWQPDWWNYAQLGNEVPLLHFHFIPRYKEKRVFAGAEFVDERWGKNYAPVPERSENKELNEKIRLAIAEKISK